MESYNPGSGEADLGTELENELKGLEGEGGEAENELGDLDKEIEGLENEAVDNEALEQLDKDL